MASYSSDQTSEPLSPASPPTPTTPSPTRRQTTGTSLFSKLPFMRPTSEHKSRQAVSEDGTKVQSGVPPGAMAAVLQQQKTRRRRGSLRKVALLARRERRDSKTLSIDTKLMPAEFAPGPALTASPARLPDGEGYGLGISSEATPRPGIEGFAAARARRGGGGGGRGGGGSGRHPFDDSPTTPTNNTSSSATVASATGIAHHATAAVTDGNEAGITSPTMSYTSTTDEEDLLHMPSPPGPQRLDLSSGAGTYFSGVGGGVDASSPGLDSLLQRRGTMQRAKSPLALGGLAVAPPLGTETGGMDDSGETEWWGWVVLVVTWFVFVTGMGSVLGVWSWAWDVGTTPYAPPELEDDPTLPIVGYYPALIILTGVMAWVWVVVAWVGMKYFRHAKISGD